MNMGGPSTLDEVQFFLTNLFSDPDLIPLPLQKFSAPIIAKRRTPRIVQQYAEIGGGSPILRWTTEQGEGMAKLLEELVGGRFKSYTMFRYANPLTQDTLDEMRRDGIKRAIAFTQYPQYSCSTTGSSLMELWRKSKASKDGIEWSVIDRWGTHPGLVEAFAQNIQATLAQYPESERSSVVLLFSAHSLPMTIVNRGDPYVSEVAATVSAIMDRLGNKNPYRLVWQSQVGPRAWMGPQTSDALKGLAKLGQKNVVLVPVAFTSDHIETLYELDLEYGKEAKEHGLNLRRAESLNASPVFIRALADIVAEHLEAIKSGTRGYTSAQMGLRCPQCPHDRCGEQKAWFAKGGLH
ncbi:ferrochelatase hem15 [Tulasnella sp. 419]|nr:ferrochelatase hem15 [Tulasnella sp. 419]